MDGFDLLPDAVILLIFNSVSDIKTLLRCRAVSRRFNSLVPQTDSLLLMVDCVISADSFDSADGAADPFLIVSLLRSIFKSLHDLVSPSPLSLLPSPSPPPPQNSPSQILRRFDRVRDLEIELPSGDLRLEKGAVVRWRAEFGRSLRSCAILGFRAIRDGGGDDLFPVGSDSDEDFARGLKTRVVWTISALIAASARHFLLREVVREQRSLRRLVLKDRDSEGTVVMDKDGLAELRSAEEEEGEEDDGGENDSAEMNRTRVPCVRMRMRHAPRLELKGGVWAEGATLVVVRPTKDDHNHHSFTGGSGSQSGLDLDDAELATWAFGGDQGLYGEAVQALLKTKSYILEMNSF